MTHCYLIFCLLFLLETDFDYNSFKELFILAKTTTSEIIIPKNDFTQFLFEENNHYRYSVQTMLEIDEHYDLFVLNCILDADIEDRIDVDLLYIFKDQILITDHSDKLLTINVTNDGGTLVQNYQLNNSIITVDYYNSECCSSTGFSNPIEVSTQMDFSVTGGLVKFNKLLKWEIQSVFFEIDSLNSIKYSDCKYPTVNNLYEIRLVNLLQEVPINQQGDRLFFYFKENDRGLIPFFTTFSKDGNKLDSLNLIDINKSDTIGFNFSDHCLKLKNNNLNLSVTKEGKIRYKIDQ